MGKTRAPERKLKNPVERAAVGYCKTTNVYVIFHQQGQHRRWEFWYRKTDELLFNYFPHLDRWRNGKATGRAGGWEKACATAVLLAQQIQSAKVLAGK